MVQGNRIEPENARAFYPFPFILGRQFGVMEMFGVDQTIQILLNKTSNLHTRAAH